jgi:hypothetical protein
VIDLEGDRVLALDGGEQEILKLVPRIEVALAGGPGVVRELELRVELLERVRGQVARRACLPCAFLMSQPISGRARERDDAGRALARDEQRRPLLCAGLRIDHVGRLPAADGDDRALELVEEHLLEGLPVLLGDLALTDVELIGS